MKKTDIIVIGAGMAGSTAAIYLKRANANFILLEGDKVGGMLNQLEKIENYPAAGVTSGKDLLDGLKAHLRNLDIEVTHSNVQAILKNSEGFEVKTDDDSYVAKAAIVACGNAKQSEFIPGEEKYFGSGVSYCAVCDANFFKGNDVAVIGNNNIVLEESLYLAGIVNKVNLICPNKLTGDSTLVEKVKNNDKIKVFEDAKVEEICGDDFGVTAVKVDGKKISVAGVFPYLGKKSATKIFSSISPAMDAQHLIVDEKMMSNVPGLFGAGDIVNKKLRQLITSAGDGAVAAYSAINYIRSK